MTKQICVEVFEAGFNSQKYAKKQPAGVLKYFDAPITEAIKNSTNNSDGNADLLFEDPTVIKWLQRLKSFTKKDLWFNHYGPSPDQDHQIPNNALAAWDKWKAGDGAEFVK